MYYGVGYTVMTQNQPSEDFTNHVNPKKIPSASNKGKSSVIEWKQGDRLKDGKDNEYEIQRILGIGGFGITYLAQIISKEGSPLVVLKTLNSTAQQDPNAKRFKQDLRDEGDSLMQIKGLGTHAPNIVRIIKNIDDLDGLPCLMMEYVEGKNLAEIIKKGKLPSRQALNYIKQIAKSLIPVHKRGINHRDIKPANIILTKNKFIYKPVLVDFGTARYFVSKTTKTRFESKGFTAPEQLLGKPEGAYTDVFSLAMTLYALVTGDNSPDPYNLKFPDDLDPKVKELICLGTRENTKLPKIAGGRPKDIQDWLGKSIKRDFPTPILVRMLLEDWLGKSIKHDFPPPIPVRMLIVIMLVLGTGGLGGLQLLNNLPKKEEVVIEIPPPPPPEPVKVYQHPEYGFKLSYPRDWYLENKKIDLEEVSFNPEVLELTPPFQEVTSSRFDSRIYVEVKPSYNQSLKQIADQAMKTLNNGISSRTVLAAKNIQLNGHSAYEVTFIGQEEGSAFQRRQIVVVTQDWQYWLTYEAPKEQFPNFEAEAEQILRSFSL